MTEEQPMKTLDQVEPKDSEAPKADAESQNKEPDVEERNQRKTLLYGVDDKPPIFLSLLLGFQHYITMYGGSVAYPYVLTPRLCMAEDDPTRAYIMATVFFTSGLATLVQTLIGIRLPLVQGCAFTFMVPILAFLNLPENQCPTFGNTNTPKTTLHLWVTNNLTGIDYPPGYACNSSIAGEANQGLLNLWVKNESQHEAWRTEKETCSKVSTLGLNTTLSGYQCQLLPKTAINTGQTGGYSDYTDPAYVKQWRTRMNKIQGAIIVGGVTEALIGLSGVMGYLLRWITPLTIVPTITQVGISMFRVCTREAGESWLFSSMTIILLTVFSQYLPEVPIPVPRLSSKGGKRITRFYLFKQFPVLVAIVFAWLVALICTLFEWLPAGHPARTDGKKVAIFKSSPWIRVPYPLQWGAPEFSSAAIIGILCGIIVSIIESIGDYYACARLCGVPPPPKSAVNRGIMAEGIGCIFSGVFGSGGAVTSYSENIGAISITKVGSRRVLQLAGLLMVGLSIFAKLSAVFSIIPVPIMGGVLTVLSSIICAVGLSTLRYVDLNSSRNLFILGTSLFLGICVPHHFIDHPGSIQTGISHIDAVLNVLLLNGMFISGAIGFFLDNTLPGTLEERGLVQWLEQQKSVENKTTDKTYRLPNVLHKITNKCTFIPVFGE